MMNFAGGWAEGRSGEFYIKYDEFCIKSDEFCIQNDGFCIKLRRC